MGRVLLVVFAVLVVAGIGYYGFSRYYLATSRTATSISIDLPVANKGDPLTAILTEKTEGDTWA